VTGQKQRIVNRPREKQNDDRRSKQSIIGFVPQRLKGFSTAYPMVRVSVSVKSFYAVC
jgi:hypothetical protein